jgi:drug/metabolite transporter (DMT)-like permease
VAAACFSGVCYAVMGVVMRRLAVRRVPVSVMLLVISTTGVITLGLGSVARLGWAGLAASDGADVSAMLGGGAFNALAFLLLGKALELAPVVQVNSVNASQTAMAAVAGIVFFGEQATVPLAIGLLLTVAGLVLISRKDPARQFFQDPPPAGE